MQSSACHRFRMLTSLALDAESSQLEQAALDRHLSACASCRSFASTVVASTAEIRSSELEAYRAGWTHPRRHRRIDELIRRSAVGLAVASAAGFAMFLGATLEAFESSSQAPRSLPALVIDASGADTARESQRFLQDCATPRSRGRSEGLTAALLRGRASSWADRFGHGRLPPLS